IAALQIAKEFVEILEPHCLKIEIAGSLRRGQIWVSDVEILFVPRFEPIRDPNDLFGGHIFENQAERTFMGLLSAGLLRKRPKVDGTFTWGDKNKLGLHAQAGIAVDFFTATETNWANFLVVRSGPKESNIAIALAALAKGWQWQAYGNGFTREIGGETKEFIPTSEREVFEFAGLAFREPWKRCKIGAATVRSSIYFPFGSFLGRAPVAGQRDYR